MMDSCKTSTVSRQEMIRWHMGILESNLHTLADGRTSTQTRRDVMQWIRDGIRDYHESVITPFSFSACCLVLGVDPIRLIETLNDVVVGVSV